jgi:asparagine synthase (glutamine-hydrolysing)
VARGELKHVMKKALAGIVPNEVLHRPKRGFGAPIGAWMKSELMPLMETLLSRPAVQSRGLVHYEPVRQLLEDHRSSRVDGTDRLLALLNLEIWCRIYVDGISPADVSDQLRQSVA